jgi:SAM-dependent methyltransferase
MPPPSAPEIEAPWYARAFDRTWLRVNARRGDEEAERNAPRILEWLGLRAGHRLLDVACGAGRYARAFARRGLAVTAVDLSEDLLAEARRRSPLLPGMPTYLRWDARALPFDRQFEGAVSLFTSIGYFEDPADDVKILRGAARALVVGGRFLLDYLNASEVRAQLVAESESVEGGLRVAVTRRLVEDALAGPLVVKSVRAQNVLSGRTEAAYEERVRLYEPDEIDALLAKAGLVPEGPRFGDFDGSPHTAASRRLIRVASRPRDPR